MEKTDWVFEELNACATRVWNTGNWEFVTANHASEGFEGEGMVHEFIIASLGKTRLVDIEWFGDLQENIEIERNPEEEGPLRQHFIKFCGNIDQLALFVEVIEERCNHEIEHKVSSVHSYMQDNPLWMLDLIGGWADKKLMAKEA